MDVPVTLRDGEGQKRLRAAQYHLGGDSPMTQVCFVYTLQHTRRIRALDTELVKCYNHYGRRWILSSHNFEQTRNIIIHT